MLRPYTEHILSSVAVAPADRVLDIGCGCGATTIAAARLAAEGQVLGVDLSDAMLGRARDAARVEGLTNVAFERGDAQVHPFAASASDAAISRFGIMLFDDAVSAFANIGRALRPGGRMAFACWQAVPENEWVTVPGIAVAQHVSLEPLTQPGRPGPFAFADPELVRSILSEAGWTGIEIASVREPVFVGSDAADTAAFFRDTGMGRAVLADLDADTGALVEAAVVDALEAYARPDGVWLSSAAWLVSARRES
jgi:SAM-dependent methyltransferase